MLLSWGLYQFQHSTHLRILKEQERNRLDLQKDYVPLKLRSIISDLWFISSDADLSTLIARHEVQAGSHIASRCMAFSKYKGVYDQLRVLDNSGMELLRVDLQGENPRFVPADELQSKINRYYFKDIHELSSGKVYMSRLDLNVEHGVIEQPYKPMIRFGMPLFNSDGTKEGVLVLNYLGDELINDLSRLSQSSPGTFMLLNADGYWLKGEDPEDEWGFMIPSRVDRTIKQRYPGIWKHIQESNSGQVLSRQGLATFVRIYPLKEGLVSSDGASRTDGTGPRYLSPDEYYWILLSFVPASDLFNGDRGFIYALILSDLILLIFTGMILWNLIEARLKRQQAERDLRTLNNDLEDKVRQRTQELSRINTELQNEIAEHNRSVEEKNKIETHLRQAQKMEAIGTLAGGVAHDFNNILTPILANAQMIEMQLPDNDPQQFELQEIVVAAKRAKELVQQILTFSRQTEHELIPLQLPTIIKEALKLLRASIPASIEIKTNINPDCRPVLADPTQLHQILMNLCTNAYHAMRDHGGTLTLSLTELEIGPEDYKTHFELIPGIYLKLEISDTGCGIPRELQEKIFEPYFTTKEQGEGTGLGLSMVHAIVKNLNGHITVYSEPGTGTTFHIYLPAIEANHEVKASASRKEVQGGREHVLLVDDEDLVRRVEARVLQKYGYAVTLAESGDEALHIFQQDPNAFDLVLTDMTMPGMSGAALIKAIHEFRPGLPAILCTGYSEVVTTEKAKSLGISRILTKPATVETLAKTVREALDHRS